jgi:hypothetical protein
VLRVLQHLSRDLWGKYNVPLAFNKDKDAYSPLAFLLAFLTTQVAAFIVAVQGDDGERILVPTLIIAAFSFGFVIPAIQWYLNALAIEGAPPQHLYDKGTVYFARWSLRLTFILTVACPLLGYFGLLPGQEKRLKFKAATVECLPPVRSGSFSTLQAHNNRQVNQLLRNYIKGLNPSSDQDVLLIEQDGDFTDDYHSFCCWTSFGKPVRAVNGKVLLVRHAPSYRSDSPTYDDLQLLPNEPEPPAKDVIEINKPNRGDFIVLILIIQKRQDVETYIFPTNPSDYNFFLRVRR